MLKQIIRTSVNSTNLSFVRNIRNFRRDPKVPGLNRRLEAFADDFIENDPETVENYEADFMNVHEAHKKFKDDEMRYQERLPGLIVKQKYFKVKQPNFLLWNEKEQIKLLHAQNPKEWDEIKLSHSFAADPETISKILKSKWQPQSEERVLKHDESVNNNWKLFKKGKLEVDPMLAAHLKQFTMRKINDISKPKFNPRLKKEEMKPSGDEFLSIITTCKKYKEEKNDENENEQLLQLQSTVTRLPKTTAFDPEDSNTILMHGKIGVSRQAMTLDQVKDKYRNFTELQHDEDDENQSKKISKFSDENQQLPEKIIKYASQEKTFALQEPNKASLQNLEIDERIRIPKTIKRDKEKVYKVGDCFYDYDGEFLYRVPGFIK